MTNELKLGISSKFELNGYTQWLMIHEESGENFEVPKWTVVNGQGQLIQVTECGGYKILGGFG